MVVRVEGRDERTERERVKNEMRRGIPREGYKKEPTWTGKGTRGRGNRETRTAMILLREVERQMLRRRETVSALTLACSLGSPFGHGHCSRCKSSARMRKRQNGK